MGSWISYSLDEGSIRQHIEPKAGIYLLCYVERTEKVVFYVGKAEDVKARLLQHLGNAEPNECIKAERKKPCLFYVMYVPTESERQKLEEENIRKYRPKCNEQLKA